MRLLVYGYGYTGAALAQRLVGDGWSASAVARSEESRAAMRDEGVRPLGPGELNEAANEAAAILIAAPPDGEGCPAFRALAPLLRTARAQPKWIGYLSTTGVYGDRGGGWVFEASRLAARSLEGARRVGAEQDWRALGHELGLNTAVFRLPGLYGPPWRGGDRSPFGRLRSGAARRIVKPGQVFSRLYRDDLVDALIAALRRPRHGAVYNLCDDEPAPPEVVTAYAARLIGIEPPPEEAFDSARLSPRNSASMPNPKRVSNALAKAELGWRPAYPSYREGLQALLSAERRRPAPPPLRSGGRCPAAGKGGDLLPAPG